MLRDPVVLIPRILYIGKYILRFGGAEMAFSGDPQRPFTSSTPVSRLPTMPWVLTKARQTVASEILHGEPVIPMTKAAPRNPRSLMILTIFVTFGGSTGSETLKRS